MTLDDIPADEMRTMTKDMARLFLAAKCEPECHCCFADIEVGMRFQLASVDGTDEMLCYECSPSDLVEKRNRDKRALEARLARPYGGYSRPSR